METGGVSTDTHSKTRFGRPTTQNTSEDHGVSTLKLAAAVSTSIKRQQVRNFDAYPL